MARYDYQGPFFDRMLGLFDARLVCYEVEPDDFRNLKLLYQYLLFAIVKLEMDFTGVGQPIPPNTAHVRSRLRERKPISLTCLRPCLSPCLRGKPTLATKRERNGS